MRLHRLFSLVMLGVVMLATVICCVAVALHSVSCEKSELATRCVLARVGNGMVGTIVMMGIVMLLIAGVVFIARAIMIDSRSRAGSIGLGLRETVELCLSDYLLTGFRLGIIRAQIYG